MLAVPCAGLRLTISGWLMSPVRVSRKVALSVPLFSRALASGAPIVIEGLWGLQTGNGHTGGDSNMVYFTAGISGGGRIQDHGLFGSIQVVQ